jgi:predicted ATPase
MLPGGTVTFLFTDIVGSTARWESDPDAMKAALAEHNEILDSLIEEYEGKTFKTVGDAYCVVFENADMAALAAKEAHQKLSESRYPLRIRIGIHTGPILPTEGDYFGPPVNKVARIQALAVGGQTLASAATKGLLGGEIEAKNLGTHQLKDLLEPIEIWQLGEGEFPDIRSIGSTRNNIPLQATSFIGRVAEMQELRGLLQVAKLITLTGAGGTGKSRLAVQVAADNLDQFPDGAWFIELASLLDRDDVMREVAEIVGVPNGEASLEERLVTHLAAKKALLILDNCEHVLSEVCALSEKILGRCPSVSIFATSREPLGLRGEKVFAVPSLDAPEPTSEMSLEALMRFGSTALFIDRLSAAAPAHRLDASQADRIRNICGRLDGIPLAIELAASRGRSMTLKEIETRLNDRFRLLTGGNRTAVSRQQTLRAMIDWSVRLLTDQQSLLFTSLSVFVGGWFLDAAEHICGAEDLGIDPLDVVDLLAALVDKSLVAFDATTGRYHLLESMRHYALERLGEESWAISHRERHARFFLAVSEATLSGAAANDDQRFKRFFANIDNYRAAIEWLLADEANIPALYASLSKTSDLWYWLRRMDDHLRLLQTVAIRGKGILGEDELRDSRFRIAHLRVVSKVPESAPLLSDTLAEYRTLGSVARAKYILNVSYPLFFQGRIDESIELLESELENPACNGGTLHYHLGNAYACLGRYEDSNQAFELAATIALANGDQFSYQAALGTIVPLNVMMGRILEALDGALDNGRNQNEQGLTISFTSSATAYSYLAMEVGERWFCALVCAETERRRLSRTHMADPFDLLVIRVIQEMVAPILDEQIMEDAKVAGRGFDWQPWLLSLLPYKASDLYREKPFFPSRNLLPSRPNS